MDPICIENFVHLKSFPFVQKMVNENNKLKKKNKELKKLIKLITSNIDVLKPNIKVKEEPVYDNDEVQIVNPPKKENVYIEIKDELNTKHYQDDTCSFNTVIGSVKTLEDYNKLTIFCQKLWLQNNSLDSLVKDNTNNKEEIQVKVEKEVVVKEQEGTDDDESAKNEDIIADNIEYMNRKKQEDEVEEVEEDEVEEDEEEEVEEDEVEEEEEEEVVEEEEEEEEVEEEEEEDDVFEIIINKKTYYTTDMKNGIIYDMDSDGEISLEVGKLTDGKHKFYKQ